MTRYQRLRRALLRRPANRYLTPAELDRAAAARQAVEEDRAQSELPLRWVFIAALVVIPAMLVVQEMAVRAGCVTC